MIKFKTKIIKLGLVILCFIYSSHTFAEQQRLQTKNPDDKSILKKAKGLLMLDYEKISLKGGGDFDFLGVHYLHQMNDWLYFGVGISGPILEGDYGGFFVVDTTLHAKKRVFGNWYVDAGLAFGGGGGGASVKNIKKLSGSGRYLKKYLGIGYKINDNYFGINYANVSISDSLIDDSVINFYYQKPLSFSIGSYADAGGKFARTNFRYRDYDSILSFELNNMSQIKPTGSYGGDIGLVSPQFSQFFSNSDYLFFGFDLGYSGLDFYNQIHGGIGHRVSVSPKINLYGQLGIGTGGWVTDTIQTGPGLLVYPKVKAEYLWDKDIGLSISAGYLAAPKGTSKNWTVGAGINYHFSAGKPGSSNVDADYDLAMKGFRVSIFHNTLFDINHNGEKVDNVNMETLQVDYMLSDHVYVPFQIGAATNDYKGYAGYVEMFTGLGWQSSYLDSEKLQGFAQLLFGINDVGVNEQEDVGPLLNASIGFNYSLSKQLAIYVQMGKTVSVNKYIKSNYSNYFRDSSIGLGITYRFSLPTRASRL